MTPSADLVVWHARIHTGDPAAPEAEALAVRSGKVVFVGADAEVGPFLAGSTVIDAGGRTVVPGFVDGHIHPVEGGVELGQCQLGDATSQQEVLALVQACDQAGPGSRWLVGAGWELTAFIGGAPSPGVLDAVVADRPVWLGSADGHSAWLNGRALAEARIDAHTPDPPGGRIERGPDGAATGLLRESAVDLAANVLPEPTRAESAEGLRRALALANRHGITTVFEADAYDAHLLRAYRDLERSGELTVRVSAALLVEPGDGVDAIRRLVAERRRFTSDRLRPVAAKIFVDGVIESHTAAMLAPYVDTGGLGLPAWTDQELRAVVSALAEASFDVHFHAIGDRAVRMALDAAEAAGPGRFTVAHLETVDAADVPRFKALGVAADFQPLWAYPDAYIRDLTVPVLGPERSATLYPIGALSRTGARLAFGSDWSVSSLDPLDGIEVAVTRRDPDATEGEALGLGQAVDVATALTAYTTGAAWVAHREGEVGRLAVGYDGDWVLLSDDPYAASPQRIGDITVLATVLGGEVVFREADLVTTGPKAR